MHASKIKGPSRSVRAVPWVGAVAAIATVVAGVVLDARGTPLGVPHPPFIGAYGPQATVWVFLAVPCFAGAVALVPTLLRAGAAVFAAALFVLTLILRLVLNFARIGPHELDRALTVAPRGEGKNEYLPSLAAFDYG